MDNKLFLDIFKTRIMHMESIVDKMKLSKDERRYYMKSLSIINKYVDDMRTDENKEFKRLKKKKADRLINRRNRKVYGKGTYKT